MFLNTCFEKIFLFADLKYSEKTREFSFFHIREEPTILSFDKNFVKSLSVVQVLWAGANPSPSEGESIVGKNYCQS